MSGARESLLCHVCHVCHVCQLHLADMELSIWATFREATEITVSTEITPSREGDLGVLKGLGTPS